VARRLRPGPAGHARPGRPDRRRPHRGGDRLHRLRRRRRPFALRGRVRGRGRRGWPGRVPRRRAGTRLGRHPRLRRSGSSAMTEAASPREDHVLVEVTVPAPADAVWAALRDPMKIRDWFGWEADTLKDEIDFIFVTHARADEATRTVVIEGVNDRYEVEPRGEHSVVRVVRCVPAGDWSDVFDGMIEGWISFTWQLAFA